MIRVTRLVVEGQTGTLTGFLKGEDDKIYGLSAYHVITAKQNLVKRPGQVTEMYFEELRKYCPVGNAFDGFYKYDEGMRTKYYDYGRFIINTQLKDQIENCLTENRSRIPQRGERVIGYSESGLRNVYGIIVEFNFEGWDVVIRFEGSTTDEGDSGMLWRDVHGNAIALHCRREIHNNRSCSMASSTYLLSRHYKQNLYSYVPSNENLVEDNTT